MEKPAPPSSPGSFLLALFVIFSSFALTAIAQLTTANNPVTVLQSHPQLSTFARLLSDTGVVSEINQRSSLTLLVPPNSALESVLNRSSGNPLPLPVVADVLRYHCLLQYLDIPQIQSMTNELGMLVTSLYQTTGRAAGQDGFVNISVARDGQIHAGLPFASTFVATLTTNISQFPYNISYMQIDQALMPLGLGRPQAAAPAILNLTTALQRSGRFNTFLGLLQSTGFTAVLAGLPAFSLFVPTDEAFQGLPNGTMRALSPSQASSLMAYHTLPAYTSSDSLKRQNSLVQTVASNGDNQKFLIQVTPASNSGSVSLSTGVDTAQVVSSIYDQPPAAAYSLNRVLLPKEIFVVAADQNNTSSPRGAPANAPVLPPSIAPVVPPVASPIVPAVSPSPPPEATAPQVASTPSTPATGVATPAPVVDIGNLPPASGPGAATENTPSSSTRVLPSAVWICVLALASKVIAT